MSRTCYGLKKWCLVIISVAILLMASLTFLPTPHALAKTVSTHTHAQPYCAPQLHSGPNNCFNNCYNVQKGYSQQSLNGWTLQVYLYIAYDDTTRAYCGWAQSDAWVYQPTNKPVGTLYDTVCGNGCPSASVAVSPRSSGTWWGTGTTTTFPAANQCAWAYAVYESLSTSTNCVLP